MYVYTYTVIQYLYCLLRTYLLVRELVRDDTGPWSADEDDEWVNVCVLLNSLFIWCVEYTYSMWLRYVSLWRFVGDGVFGLCVLTHSSTRILEFLKIVKGIP